jgi:2-oxoisovalerate dehydrogenase E1 component
MATFIDIAPRSPWRSFSVSAADWDAADGELLQRMLLQMQMIRSFEEAMLGLAKENLVNGPVHSSIGQEGGAVGAITALRPGDQVSGSHRAHHQFLARMFTHFDLRWCETLPFEIEEGLEKTAAEILGLRTGWCGGRGGSIHLSWPEYGMWGSNAIVGGGVPFAAGFAWAQRRAARGEISVTFIGDGAIHIGSVQETLNLAALWDLPICFFIENNRYAVATTLEESTRETRLSSRGVGIGIPAYHVDGMDPLAVRLLMDQVATDLRAGSGPAVVEADVYRYYHQSGPLPGSSFRYRTAEEEAIWKARDPIERTADALVRRGVISREQVTVSQHRTRHVMDRIVARLTETVNGARCIVQSLWPDPATCDEGVRGDLSELTGERFLEASEHTGATRTVRFVDTISMVIGRNLDRDPRVVLLGEDIHRLNGGTNGATRGLFERFPDRVLPTPITENGFVGFAGGLAMDGRHHPVVELMYSDFAWVAADQIFNQVAKARHMFARGTRMPFVMRAKVALGTGYGSQHSLDPAGLYSTSAGFRLVAPSTPHDYIGLFNAAIRCDDPVYILEHVELYKMRGEVPLDDLDYCLPLGRARLVRAGKTMTIVSYLWSVHECLGVIEKLGVDAELIDLRSLDRAGIDWDMLCTSIAKTHNVLLVEQGPLATSYFGWLADEIQRRLFDELDQPIQRVHGRETAPAISRVLERATMAGPEQITHGIRRVLRERGGHAV